MPQAALIWLEAAPPAPRAHVGGKAASLMRLHQAGFRVPPGFVLSAPHLARMDADALRAVLAEALPELRRRIPDAPGVMVRSSGVMEDAATQSLAGQLLTRPAPLELEALLQAVGEVCASLRDAPAGQMAVIVQALIPAEVAGVLFSRDPQQPHALSIEAAWGMGAAVVEGRVAPDRWWLARESGQVLRAQIQHQAERYRVAPDGQGLLAEAAPQAAQPCLSDAQLSELVALAQAIEAAQDAPQDIEWAYHEGLLYLLQARPITARDDPAAEALYHDPSDPDALWTSGFFEERFPHAVTPLTWGYVFPPVAQTALVEPLRFVGVRRPPPRLRRYRGHVYANVAIFQSLYRCFPGLFLPDDARRFFPGGDVRLRKAIKRPSWLMFFVHAALTVLTEWRWHPLNYVYWPGFVRRNTAELARIRRLSDPLARLDALTQRTLALLRLHRWSLIYAEIFGSLLRRAVNAWTALPFERVQSYLVATAQSPSQANDRALQAIADRARQLGASPEDDLSAHPELAAMMRDFLADFGHRSFNMDFRYPRYADDPGEVWAVIARQMHGPAESARQAERQTQREALEAQLWQQLRRRWWDRLVPYKRALMALTLHLARAYFDLREAQRFEWQKILHQARRDFVALEDAWRQQGLLTQAGDVVYLTWDEVRRAVADPQSLKQLTPPLDARRRAFRRIQAAPMPRFLRGDAALTDEHAADPSRVLQGVEASAGQAIGRARIVHHAEQLSDLLARVEEGDILVTRATDPGWTPLFSRLRGLVMSTGGRLSHGAIVAREYGLPAVVAVEDATRHLREGERLLVDGDAGTVTRLEAEA